eukprot:g8369.t1
MVVPDTSVGRDILSPGKQGRDEETQKIRPSSFDQFIGQKALCENLRVFIAAAQIQEKPLDHVLLAGPPGLGKTTFAHVIAQQLGVGLRVTSAPIITRPGELASLLTNLQPRDVLFIDEIHRLSPLVEEVLYPAMEDFKLDIMIGEGPAAQAVRIDIAPFTLIAATTRSGLLTSPLRDRFGIPLTLTFYTPEELEQILHRAALILKTNLHQEGAREIARRARGTPRIALRLLKRVHDFAVVQGQAQIEKDLAHQALLKLDVDERGLDALDRRYLSYIATHFKGGPVGIETLSAALAEERDTLEDVVEPYLLQQGLIQRTPRGRVLNPEVYGLLGLPALL